MAEKAGFEIRADLAALRKELQQAAAEFREFNQNALKAATGVTSLEGNANKAGRALRQTELASRALAFGLGQLGAQSIEQVIVRMIDFGRNSIQMAVTLQAVENRAKAVFGSAFPAVQAQMEEMSQRMHRSTSDLLEFGTGFANLMDSVGVSGDALKKYSGQLTELTVTLGRAFPDKSDAEVYSIIEAGILGNTRGLRQLGIAMKDDQLQRFATSKGIKLLLKDMDDEQKVRLRTMFLLEETANLQDAATASARDGIDAAKEFGAVWKDFAETLGTAVMPLVTDFFRGLAGMIQGMIVMAGQLKASLLDAVSFGQFSDFTGQKAALTEHQKLTDANILFQQQHGIGLGKARKTLLPGEFEAALDPWAKRSKSGGGGGGDPAKEQKKLLEDMEKIEKDILSTVGEQAKSNNERVKSLKEELELKRRLGTLTAAEERMLERLNRRVEFQEDKVKAATDAWEDQVAAVKKVNDEITDLNAKLAEEATDLRKTLADIDRDTKTQKAEKLSDLVKELRDAEAEINDANTSNARKIELENRRRELEKTIDPLRLSEEGRAQLTEAEKASALNPLQAIDAEAERKKKEAVAESSARTEGLLNELSQARINKDEIETLERQKKQAVLDALSERAEKTAATYAKIQSDTKAHVDSQIAEFARLAAAARVPATAAIRRAAGGPVSGPGGPTDDRIPAWLSNGEYVINAAATRMYRPLIERINAMGLPRFAQGGAVTNHSEKTVHFTMHNHGDAARAYGNPRLAAWLVRTTF